MPRPRNLETQLDAFPDRQPRPPLSRIAAPYQRESETSKEAALRIVPKVNALRDKVYDAIVAAGEAGATRKELEAVTGIITQTITARIHELKEEGAIRPLTYFDLEKRAVATVRREACEVLVVARGAA